MTGVRVSVIIVTYQSWATIERALDPLFRAHTQRLAEISASGIETRSSSGRFTVEHGAG